MVSEDESIAVNCKELGIPPCYDCKWGDTRGRGDAECEIARHSQHYREDSIKDLKINSLYYIKYQRFHPEGTLARHEKALELCRPELYEWFQKIKVLM